MPIFFERSVRTNGKEYRIEMDLDDEAIMDGYAKFQIIAKMRTLPDGEWYDEVLDIETKFSEQRILISHKGEVKATLRLDLPFEESEDFEGNDIDIDLDDKIFTENLCNEFGKNLTEELGAGAAESIISSIPTDPFLGCLLKGALSTAVGQVIRCWHYHKEITSSFQETASNVCGCLKEYSQRMLFTFMYRSGKCIVTCGLSG